MKKRIRRGARIFLRREDGAVLLFRFSYDRGALAGRTYWAIPGGGVDDCETPEAGAIRELREETGISVEEVGPVLFESEYDMTMMSGEIVLQHDYHFRVDVPGSVPLSRDGFTAEERQSLVEARWWRPEEMSSSEDCFLPADLPEILEKNLTAD